MLESILLVAGSFVLAILVSVLAGLVCVLGMALSTWLARLLTGAVSSDSLVGDVLQRVSCPMMTERASKAMLWASIGGVFAMMLLAAIHAPLAGAMLAFGCIFPWSFNIVEAIFDRYFPGASAEIRCVFHRLFIELLGISVRAAADRNQ